ncbi:MAG: translation initiation factor IF-6 [Candidatus Bathyarchaeia archaeon]
MVLRSINILGSPNVGVHALATDSYALVPTGMSPRKRLAFEETLKARVVALDAGHSKLNGTLMVGNASGILLPHFASTDEVALLRRELKLNVERFDSLKTALGNIILANDKGAVVAGNFTSAQRRVISDVLNVETVEGQINGQCIVGSMATATNRGALVHPDASPEERNTVSTALRVPVASGTVNGGVPLVGSGLIANSHGIIVGSFTTGPELMMISRVLEA